MSDKWWDLGWFTDSRQAYSVSHYNIGQFYVSKGVLNTAIITLSSESIKGFQCFQPLLVFFSSTEPISTVSSHHTGPFKCEPLSVTIVRRESGRSFVERMY